MQARGVGLGIGIMRGFFLERMNSEVLGELPPFVGYNGGREELDDGWEEYFEMSLFGDL